MLKTNKPTELRAQDCAIADANGAHTTSTFGLSRGFFRVLCNSLGAIALGILVSQTAQAALMSFEDPMDPTLAPYAPLFGHGDEYDQAGFFMVTLSNSNGAQPGDLVGAMVDGADVANTCFSVVCPSNNLTKFYTGLNDGYVVIGTLDGKPFTVNAFDASFVGNGDPLPPVAGLIAFDGVNIDGNEFVQYFNLAGPDAQGALGFNHYTPSNAYINMQWDIMFVFGFACDSNGDCTAFSSNTGQYALDNLDMTAIPEPASLALLAVGLAAMGGIRRRRSTVVGTAKRTI